jgi:DNA mismatch repair protein MutL
VKFDDERGLASLVRSVVKKALFARYGFETPQATADPGQPVSIPGVNSGNRMPFASGGAFPFGGSFKKGEGFSFQRPNYDRRTPPPVNAAALLYAPIQKSEKAASLFQDVAPTKSATTAAEIKTFWQLHNSYILTQTLTGLCIVDQSAAHRRILYERALATANNALPSTQQLLFPQTLDFSATDFQLLKELHAEIAQMGFNLQLVSGNSAILTGVPADVEVGDEKTVVHSILAAYTDIGRKTVLSAREKLAAAMAMRLAIPRGKRLSPAEMEQLVDRLFACNQPFADALGRPTLVYLSLDEIAQRFGART